MIKQVHSLMDIRIELAQVDWSAKEIFKTIVFFVSTVVANFLSYTDIAPVLLKILVVAMIIDTFLGARVARKIRKDYSSKLLRAGIYEKGLYLTVFLGLAYILKGLKLDYEWLPTTMFTVLVIAEVISFLGNLISLRTGKISEEFDLITILIKVLRSLFRYIANASIDAIKHIGSKKEQKKEEEQKQDEGNSI